MWLQDKRLKSQIILEGYVTTRQKTEITDNFRRLCDYKTKDW
jgi:hypothetical protein